MSDQPQQTDLTQIDVRPFQRQAFMDVIAASFEREAALRAENLALRAALADMQKGT